MHEVGDGADDVLAGVQDQQQLAVAQRVGQGGGYRPVGLLVDAQVSRNAPGRQRRVGAVGELDQPHPVGEIGRELPGQPGCQPGFANTARSAQCQRADIAEQ